VNPTWSKPVIDRDPNEVTVSDQLIDGLVVPGTGAPTQSESSPMKVHQNGQPLALFQHLGLIEPDIHRDKGREPREDTLKCRRDLQVFRVNPIVIPSGKGGLQRPEKGPGRFPEEGDPGMKGAHRIVQDLDAVVDFRISGQHQPEQGSNHQHGHRQDLEDLIGELQA